MARAIASPGKDCQRGVILSDQIQRTLRGHQDNLLIQCDVGFVAKETRDHELRAVANGIHGTVLHDNPLVANQERLKRADDTTQVGLCTNKSSGGCEKPDKIGAHHLVCCRTSTARPRHRAW